jgi:hypothetical protein
MGASFAADKRSRYSKFPDQNSERCGSGNRWAARYVVAGGVGFYVVGYIGTGMFFGFDFGREYFPQSDLKQFVNGSLFILTVVGLYFGLFMGTVGAFLDFGIARKGRLGYLIAMSAYILGLFWATASAILLFNRMPFFSIAVTSRAVGAIMLPKLNQDNWVIVVGIFTSCCVILLPALAYISGGGV